MTPENNNKVNDKFWNVQIPEKYVCIYLFIYSKALLLFRKQQNQNPGNHPQKGNQHSVNSRFSKPFKINSPLCVSVKIT